MRRRHGILHSRIDGVSVGTYEDPFEIEMELDTALTYKTRPALGPVSYTGALFSTPADKLPSTCPDPAPGGNELVEVPSPWYDWTNGFCIEASDMHAVKGCSCCDRRGRRRTASAAGTPRQHGAMQLPPLPASPPTAALPPALRSPPTPANEAALNVYARPCDNTRQIMTLEHLQALARYNRWMNEKIYAVAAKLTDEERKRDRGAFFKSIHATLNHILLADRVWMGRFTGVKLQGDWLGPDGIRTLDQELYASFVELRDERVTMDAAIEQWVTGLTADQLTSTLRYVRKQVPQECPLWWAVAHFFNHQTHHRGQISTLLMQAGHDPGVTDLFAMLREETTATRS